MNKVYPLGNNSDIPSTKCELGEAGVVVNHIITAGTEAHATRVSIMSHTAVIFSAIRYGFSGRYINFQITFLK